VKRGEERRTEKKGREEKGGVPKHVLVRTQVNGLHNRGT
jgi:hypothetical protein